MADGYSRPIFKYFHKAGTQAAVQIKSGPGILRSVTFGTTGATPGTITVADNVVPDGSNPISILVPAANSTPVTYEFDVAFNTGLAFTNSGGTTADVTIAYF